LEVLKWEKYKFLADIGLTSFEYLENTISRYEKKDIDKLIEDICLYFNKNQKNSVLLVIKFVTMYDSGQLYNLRLETKPNANQLKHQILSNTHPDVVEYWFCGSEIKKKFDNFSGRYLVDNKTTNPDVIEIIWWASPRLLESDITKLNYPYVPFLKYFPSKKFVKQSMPNRAKQISENEINTCLNKVLDLIKRKADQIYFLEEILRSVKIDVYSLEFKFENGIGNFIDWDTVNDKKALETYHSNRTRFNV
jgi:hypothetical protein